MLPAKPFSWVPISRSQSLPLLWWPAAQSNVYQPMSGADLPPQSRAGDQAQQEIRKQGQALRMWRPASALPLAAARWRRPSESSLPPPHVPCGSCSH